MGQPGYVHLQPPKPPVSGWDIAVSVITLIVTALLGAAAAVFGLFLLAFLDHCPPESCSVQGAVTAVGSALLIALLVGVTGLVATVVQLVRRSPAWPFALATLVLCATAILLGGVGFDVAVGA